MKEWFYTVTQSMVELGLRGAELSLFAILNGYSQRQEGCFFGTRNTLAEQCGIKSTRTIDTTLRSLLDKGLIRKFSITISGRDYIAYSVTGDWGVSKNCAPQSKNCAGGEQNLLREGAKIAHMKNIYKDNNKIPPLTPPSGGEGRGGVKTRDRRSARQPQLRQMTEEEYIKSLMK